MDEFIPDIKAATRITLVNYQNGGELVIVPEEFSQQKAIPKLRGGAVENQRR